MEPPALPAPASSSKPLVLRDSGAGPQIMLEGDLPEEAYGQLIALDLGRFSIGPLHYDQAMHRWRSELDEAAAMPSPAGKRALRSY